MAYYIHGAMKEKEMKSEFLKKEHWHQGEDCTFAKFTDEYGTELFAEFESETKVRVWGNAEVDECMCKIEIRGIHPSGNIMLWDSHEIIPESRLVHPWAEWPTFFAEVLGKVMFSDRYQAFRKQQMALESLADVRREMEQLKKWEEKFLTEAYEAAQGYYMEIILAE